MATVFQGPTNFNAQALPSNQNAFASLLSTFANLERQKSANKGALVNTVAKEGIQTLGSRFGFSPDFQEGKRTLEFIRELNPNQNIPDRPLTGSAANALISSGDLSTFKQGKESSLQNQRLGRVAGDAPDSDLAAMVANLIKEEAARKAGAPTPPVPTTGTPSAATVTPGATTQTGGQAPTATGGSPASSATSFSTGLDAQEVTGPATDLFAKQRQQMEKTGLDIQDKGRQQGLLQNMRIGEYDPVGADLNGSFDVPFVRQTEQGIETVKATAPINNAQQAFDLMAANNPDGAGKLIEDYSKNYNDTRQMMQVYGNLKLLNDEMELQGRDRGEVFGRTMQIVQNNPELLPQFLQGSDSISGLFRNDPLSIAAAKQFAILEAKKLDLARNNNGGRPSDKDFDKVAAQFGTIFDSPEGLQIFGQGIVGIFGQAALDGAVKTRNSGEFNRLLPEVEGFLGQRYEFGIPLGNEVSGLIKQSRQERRFDNARFLPRTVQRFGREAQQPQVDNSPEATNLRRQDYIKTLREGGVTLR